MSYRTVITFDDLSQLLIEEGALGATVARRAHSGDTWGPPEPIDLRHEGDDDRG